MARATLLFLLVSVALRTAYASDTKSFFAYLKEHSVEQEPEALQASAGREGRQDPVTTPAPITIALQFQGPNFPTSNFNFAFNFPANPPVTCGGDPLNYCNYPDLPLIETYDLNYYSRRPIPSGRCPVGYTKMQTFDCLNIAPALFETTCCVFAPPVTPAVLTDATPINAFFCLCNSTCYVITNTGAAYGFNIRSASAGGATPVFGPISVNSLTAGCITTGANIAEAETLGNCSIIFFTFDDRFCIVNPITGTNSGLKLVTDIGVTGTPNVVYTLFNGGPLITQIDFTPGPLFRVTLLSSSPPTTVTASSTNPATSFSDSNFVFGPGVTGLSADVQPPLLLRSAPFTSASAASYIPSLDLIAFIINQDNANQIFFVDRQGTLKGGATVTRTGQPFVLSGGLRFCSIFGACFGSSTSTSGTVVAPLVYIPYPIYPVFTGQQPVG